MNNLRHPDAISGLAPDCRRVLRDAYQKIEAISQRFSSREVEVIVNPYGVRGGYYETRREDLREANGCAVGKAIQEYREICALWGVEP